jgi:hypothetical protein
LIGAMRALDEAVLLGRLPITEPHTH